MKKIAAALILICLFAVGCTPQTDVDIDALLASMIPEAQAINEILWGDGLPVEGEIDEEATVAVYLPVTADSPYQTLDELKAAVRRVYSAEYSAVIEEALLTNSDDAQARYAENNSGVLTLNVTSEPFSLETQFDLSQARLKSANKYMLTVEVPYTVRDRSGKLDLLLINESGNWRFDGPTY